MSKFHIIFFYTCHMRIPS